MKKSLLQLVQNGQVSEIEEKRYIFSGDEFEKIVMPGIVAYFCDPKFPEAGVDPRLGIEEASEETLPDGSVAVIVNTVLHVRPHWDVFLNAGLVAKVLAENVSGKNPRHVSLVVHHSGNLLVVGFDVRSKKE